MFIIIASAAVMVAGVMTSQPLQSANDRSRWSTVWSLVERGTYQIDEIDQFSNWSTIDKVRHRHSESEPYHFYSSKPPLLSTIVAGIYRLERMTFGYTLYKDTTIASRIILLIVNVLPATLALFSFRNALNLLSMSRTATTFMLLVAGLATMLNPFYTTLNNHTPAAVSLVFCLSALVRLNAAPQGQQKFLDFAIAGFTAALTCCFELPAALFSVLSFLFVCKSNLRQTVKAYIPAALIPLAAFFITNWICTGGIKPFYTYYGTDKYVYTHNGVPSYWTNPQGIDANQEAPLTYAFHCIVGHHGIISLTPVFLLTLFGWIAGFRITAWKSHRWILLFGAGISACVLLFYLSRTQNYNYGGNSSALRWMLWLTPFWWYGMLPVIDPVLSRRSGRMFAGILLLASVFMSTYSLSQPWKPSWLYSTLQQSGLINYSTKRPAFDPPRYAIINRLPENEGESATWIGGAGLQSKSLTLTRSADTTIDGKPAVLMKVTLLLQPQDSQTLQSTGLCAILTEPFAAGQDISEWLVEVPADQWPEDSSADLAAKSFSTMQLTTISTLLRGMPARRAYNNGGTRWYHVFGADQDAVECQRAASRVSFDHPRLGRCIHRCDVIYCSQLPFGVWKWTETVTLQSSGALVSAGSWEAELP
jgi:hypothetical protein